MIIRSRSLITGKQNLEPLYTFRNFPVFLGCVEDLNSENDLRMDMSWAICPESGIIQLDRLVPLDVLYRGQHFDGTGPTWNQYYQDFTDYILHQSPKNVLEIGGGLGILAESFINNTQDTTWTIVEPNPSFKEKDRIKVFKAFFDKDFRYNETCDTVVHSQVIEHMYYPEDFFRTISDFLEPGNKMIFGYPNLHLYLNKKYTNAINFEHTIFLTDYFVDMFLVKHGFDIIDKTLYKEHIFCTAEKMAYPKECPVLENKYEEYKAIFLGFIEYHKALVQRINCKIDSFPGDVFVFGAHIFSQYLFEFGLKKNKIKAILDNSKMKQNKRLYGTPFLVKSPEILRNHDHCAVVLKVAAYRDEIIKQINEINPAVEILE